VIHSAWQDDVGEHQRQQWADWAAATTSDRERPSRLRWTTATSRCRPKPSLLPRTTNQSRATPACRLSGTAVALWSWPRLIQSRRPYGTHVCCETTERMWQPQQQYSNNNYTVSPKKFTLFAALHAMQTRSSDENSVCLSVRPSVKGVICDKMEERSVQIFISY